MKFELPTIRDHGSIVEHTFWRCPSNEDTDGFPPGGKNPQDMQLDKHGECSHT
jgi:hypothetical protein